MPTGPQTEPETETLTERHECHVVTGPPAAGKSALARALARELGACLLDSDGVSERLVRAGLALAGMDPDDRDSPRYKAAFRDAVYENLFDLARTNLEFCPVVVAGPFTREGGDPAWPQHLEHRLGTRPELHFVWCDPETRRRRMVSRGETRDLPKLRDWDGYVQDCREDRPVWPHRFVDTSGL